MQVDLTVVSHSNISKQHSPRPFPRLISSIQDNKAMIILEGAIGIKSTGISYSHIPESFNPTIQEHNDLHPGALVSEVRSPLTSIKLAAELLGTEDLSEGQRQFIDVILRGVSRINNMVTNLISENPVTCR